MGDRQVRGHGRGHHARDHDQVQVVGEHPEPGRVPFVEGGAQMHAGGRDIQQADEHRGGEGQQEPDRLRRRHVSRRIGQTRGDHQFAERDDEDLLVPLGEMPAPRPQVAGLGSAQPRVGQPSRGAP